MRSGGGDPDTFDCDSADMPAVSNRRDILTTEPIGWGRLQPFATQFMAMGGHNEIVACAQDGAAAKAALMAAASEVLRIEAKYSRYRADSLVCQINRQAGTSAHLPCDDETNRLLACADHFHRLSDGLFDATSGVLRRAWDFSTHRIPDAADLEPLLALVGWHGVERSSRGVRLPRSGMEIDFGGIGKEYAADRAASRLAGLGIRHGYVNLGGDIAVVGPQPDGAPWPMGVQNPRRRGEVLAHIPMSYGGLATSGDGEKFFEVGGKRYCHILNPKTGYPVHHWASVSVRTDSALSAGALSTIAMLKERDGLAFLRGQPCAYFVVDIGGRIHANQPDNKDRRA